MKKMMAIFVCVAMMLSFASAQSRELVELQKVLQATNASWTATDNQISRMNPIDQEKLLGLLPAVGDLANLPAPTMIVTPVRSERFEAVHTSIKDQGQCGSCYSFGASASYESSRMIQGENYDISEQWFMMKAKAIGPYGGCQGWYLDTSMNLLKNYGVANEADCKYLAYESACTAGNPIHKISSWAVTTDLTTIKNALQRYGLVYVGFAVYSDFFNYAGGYYAYTSGSLRGYHAVAIVGYDETGFKVKNSWGTGWGEAGYFRIKYSQMDNSVQFGKCFGGSYYIND